LPILVAKAMAFGSSLDMQKNNENLCGLLSNGSGNGLSTAAKIVSSRDFANASSRLLKKGSRRRQATVIH
jgi:hypothetical protein